MHSAVVGYLVEQGANVNESNKVGMTALMAAAKDGHNDVVKLLIKHGADVRAETGEGITAIVFANMFGHKKVKQALLMNGADPAKANLSNDKMMDMFINMLSRDRQTRKLAVKLKKIINMKKSNNSWINEKSANELKLIGLQGVLQNLMK